MKIDGLAKIPTKAHDTDAGFDIYARIPQGHIELGDWCVIPTGIAISVPKGWAMIIMGRSGLASKYGMDVLGGVIDHGYTGEVKVILSPANGIRCTYSISDGDKIAQGILVPVPEAHIEVVETLEESDRGEKGFGSSGK